MVWSFARLTRHPTRDFFVCDIFSALPKDDMASMEHPMFSLSTRPDKRILSYEHNGTEITVVPSVKGLATLHDKDILIYCISQLMAALNAGREISRTLTLSEVVAGLNALGVAPRDMIDILKSIKAAGALHAEFVVR